MTFTHLPAVASFINRHHCAFGALECGTDETLRILGDLNHSIQTSPAVVGATYKAWQYNQDCGILKTFITVEKDPAGFWTVTEKTTE